MAANGSTPIVLKFFNTDLAIRVWQYGSGSGRAVVPSLPILTEEGAGCSDQGLSLLVASTAKFLGRFGDDLVIDLV
jgi:hypothetical protein